MPLKENIDTLLLGKNEEGYAISEMYESPSTPEKSPEKIFFVLEMPNNPVLAEEIAKEVYQCLIDNFFVDNDRDPYLRFEDSLKQVNLLIQNKQREKDFRFIANLNMAVGVIARDNLYLTQTGDSEVYLIRGKYVSIISEGLKEDDSYDELFTNIASGTLEDKDAVIFSSTKLLRYLTEIDLSKIFSNYSLSEALAELKSLLKSEVTNRASVMGIDIQEMNILPETEESKKTRHFQFIRRIESIAGYAGGIIQFFTDIFNELKALRRFSVQRYFTRKKQIFLTASVVLIFVLSFGVYSLKVSSSEQKKIRQFQSDLEGIRDDIDRAKTTSNYDKKKAGGLLKNAEKNTMIVLNSGYLKAEARKILEQIYIQKDTLDNIRRVSAKEQRLVADLGKKRNTVSAIGILPYKEHLAVFESDALYEILLDKITDPLTIDDAESVIRGAYLQDSGALVFLTKSGKIIEFKDGIFSFMDTEDRGWHSGMSLAAYSDKVYILDVQNNQIWKYKRKRENYSAPDKYLLEGMPSGQAGDLAGAISFAIDGSVYVLKSSGVIDKYYVGKKKSIRIENEPISSPTSVRAIYTEKEMDQVYVLDGARKRILVYYKLTNSDNLSYGMQIILEGIKEELRDLYVDKKSQRLYVLTSSKVYEVGL